jgi:Heterokaryon incompatibility protein (HET)
LQIQFDCQELRVLKPKSKLPNAILYMPILLFDFSSFFGSLWSFLLLIPILSGSKVPKTTAIIKAHVVDKGVQFCSFVLFATMVFLLNLGYFYFLKWPRIMPQYRYSPISQQPDIIRLLRLLQCRGEQENFLQFSTFVPSIVMVFVLNLGLFYFLKWKWPRIMPRYRYSPLSQNPDVIRLLRLLPCKDKREENLQCELFEYSLRGSDSTNHPYEALSYVWGSERTPESIVIDNQKLAVTKNLYMALSRLRDREIPRIIWADAVCINQADEKEKEHQIQFMSAIYAKASRVIVWLGEAKDNSDQALELIRRTSENSEKPSNIELSIQHLLKRPWFHRIWVRKQNYIMLVAVTKYLLGSARNGCSSAYPNHVWSHRN